MRAPGGRPTKGAGRIHYLAPGVAKPVQITRLQKAYLPTEKVVEYLRRTPPNNDLFPELARLLRLSVDSLLAMGGGYDARGAALRFPMFDVERKPTGARLRRRDGKKWSLRGGKEGVFMSQDFDPHKAVFIAEGPTDSAALVEAGIRNVLGRPNCSGGVEIIKGLLTNRRTPVVVLSDPDDCGIAGAERLVMSVPNPCVVLSSEEDIRQFVTKFPVRSHAAQSIVSVLTGCRSPWTVVDKNTAGHCFDFSQLAKRCNDVKAVGYFAGVSQTAN